MFVVGSNNPPFRILGVGFLQENFFLFSELVPKILRLEIDFTEFPLPKRVVFTSLKSSGLLLFCHRKVEFEEDGFPGIKNEIPFIAGNLF